MTTTFAEKVLGTVTEFLQTVVMVDDAAYRLADPANDDERPGEPGEAEAEAATPEPSGPEVVRVGDAAQASVAVVDADAVEEVYSSPAPRRNLGGLKRPSVPPNPEELDAKETAKAFAVLGLTCAILSPQSRDENAEIDSPLLRAARRADLVVLDWNLNDDQGKATLHLFGELLKQDTRTHRRLRVIAIYTGESDLIDICDKLKVVATDGGLTPEGDPDRPEFTSGAVRVTVLCKEHVVTLAPALESQRTTIGDLPTTLARQFAELCTGLVSAATISALTGVRQETHRLLSAMSPDMDPAFLGHRAMLPHPADAERHLEDLIASEMAAVIADRRAGDLADLDMCLAWIASQGSLPPGGVHSSVTAANREAFLRVGGAEDNVSLLDEETKAGGGKWSATALKKLAPDATEMFVATRDAAIASNRRFFERMVLRSHYQNPIPTLQLGSIIESDGTFFVCIQPLCDSVRLHTTTQFPLLRLFQPDGAVGGSRALVLRDPDHTETWLELMLETGTDALRLVTFDPAEDGTVRAVPSGHARVFMAHSETAGASVPYRWIGDLKIDHAQRVVELVGGNLSRVGPNDPEVLRVRKPPKRP